MRRKSIWSAVASDDQMAAARGVGDPGGLGICRTLQVFDGRLQGGTIVRPAEPPEQRLAEIAVTARLLAFGQSVRQAAEVVDRLVQSRHVTGALVMAEQCAAEVDGDQP
ncbi:hypothetical protein J5X84_24715 [Streptosporangiaceae bacterium NEAU-GS5]|nr:hypothetical protein [Streptosporangiaceae bacterium NEAU-GS5]